LATAAWTDPSGNPRQGRVVAPPGARAGSIMTIWVDDAGKITTRPRSSGDAAAHAFGIGFLTAVGIATVGCAGFLLFRRALDTWRARQWAAGWAVVEPVWSRAVL
jgi:hypothetical protein